MSTVAKSLIEKFGEESLPIGKVVMIFNVGDQTFTSRDCCNHLRDVRRKYLDVGDVGKTWFVLHTKHTQWKINGSISFAIDNMYYVNYRI